MLANQHNVREDRISGKKLADKFSKSDAKASKEIEMSYKDHNRKKRNRRSLKKNKCMQINVIGKSVSVVGINTAGITSKMQ